jgi:uncharacterized membrane protein
MFKLPTLPPWSGLHPIAVHLPIGVLAAVPLLLLLALCFGRVNKGIAGATLIMLLIGAAGCVLATATGEEAAESAITTAQSDIILEEHEELAELTRNFFLALAGGYLVILLVAAGLKDRLKRSGWVVAHILFLVAYGFGTLALINTGHLGGRLVHEFGVRADITGPADAAGGTARDDDHDADNR